MKFGTSTACFHRLKLEKGTFELKITSAGLVLLPLNPLMLPHVYMYMKTDRVYIRICTFGI